MGVGGCYGCIKYLMFAFNFLFWLLGCAILGVGIWVRVDPNFAHYVGSNDTIAHIYVGAYILIAVGAVVMVIGFLGCCGAIRESQCMLATFFLFLFIIFGILLGAGIWAIIAKDSMQDAVTDMLVQSAERYGEDEDAKARMDWLHNKFGCCGAVNGISDFGSVMPETCQMSEYTNPCKEEVFEFFEEHLVIIAGVAIGIGVVMLLGMIFSMMLCCAIRESVA